MNRDGKSWWLLLGLVVAFNWVHVGCASSEAGPECSSDFECTANEECDTERGVCQAAIRDSNNDNNNNGLPDTTLEPADSGNNEVPDTETDTDEDTNTDPPDVGGDEDTNDPNVCDPACGPDEHCDSGACVPNATDPTCTQKGESCDPSLSDQGSFWCAGDGNGGGECLPKCSNTFSADGCGSAEYCWNIGSEVEPAPACIESECQSNSDCTSGTCLNFDNQFGLCLPSGSTPEGQSCDPNTANTCAPGLMCRSEPSGSNQGACRTLCDLWTAPSCPSGQLCNLFSPREGLCVGDVDASGDQPYTACSTSGNMCDHAVPCIGFADGSNGCMPYCRPGMGDCPAHPNGTIVCNNYVVPGQRAWGLCLGACSTSADCGGDPCQAGICRRSCTPGNEVQDCCGGNADCDWSCVGGLCE